jgi:tRNA 2-thiouridine synthesizing protein A
MTPASTTPQADREVDARGLNCPLPILRTKKALNEMQTGQVLRVVATDPASQRDFQAFSRQTGNALVDQSAANGEFIFLLRRK